MLVRRELQGIPATVYEKSAHTHVLFVGFVTEMILGVALWLFPRPHKDDLRYSPRVAATAYWLLTIGTVARVAGEIARDNFDGFALRLAVVCAGLAQIAGVGLFFYTMWSRIRAVGSKSREATGERF